MMYTLKTPNSLYKGITEGVPFSKGIGQTDDKNTRNVLVNDYKYEDVTDYSAVEKRAKEAVKNTTDTAEEVAKTLQKLASASEAYFQGLTVPELKQEAKNLGLTNYSELKKEELITLLEKTTK